MGLGGLKETTMLLPHPLPQPLSIVVSLRDREVAYSVPRVWISNPVSGGLCHLTMLTRFSWPNLACMWTKSGLKPDSFNLVFSSQKYTRDNKINLIIMSIYYDKLSYFYKVQMLGNYLTICKTHSYYILICFADSLTIFSDIIMSLFKRECLIMVQIYNDNIMTIRICLSVCQWVTTFAYTYMYSVISSYIMKNYVAMYTLWKHSPLEKTIRNTQQWQNILSK